MKTAKQSGWSLYQNSDRFVTVHNDRGSYGEFSVNDAGQILAGTANDVDLFDLPISVVLLIRFWLGVITPEDYQRGYDALFTEGAR